MEFQGSTQSMTTRTLQQHMTKTFGWMALGVFVTFVVAFLMSTNWELMYSIWSISMAPMIILIAQLGVCIALGARLMKMSVGSTKLLFMAYAVLTGITFSVLAFAFDFGTIAMAFLITCLFFGSLCVIGATTKRDLSKMGTICMAGLFAMILYSLLGMIFRFTMDSYVYAAIGLVLFMGITAWDVQKLKSMYYAYQYDEVMLSKLGIYSAFQLYLDFINIFLYILRFVGNNKD